MNTNSQIYNMLNGQSSLGENAAAMTGNMGTTVGANMANTSMAGTAAQNNYMTGAAAAQAAGQVGTANAYTGALGSIGNTAMTLGTMNYLGQMNNPYNNVVNQTAVPATMNMAYNGAYNPAAMGDYQPLPSSGGAMMNLSTLSGTNGSGY